MKIKRIGKQWCIPAITISPSTIPGRFIVKEHVGLRRKVKVCSFQLAKEVAFRMLK